jgi:cysteine synthase
MEERFLFLEDTEMKNPLEEVFENSVFRSLRPHGKKFIDAQWLPLRSGLNPFARQNIRMAALTTFNVFPHIKTVAAVQMMMEDCEKGLYNDKHTIVIDSSGNTAHAVARLAPAFGFSKVKAVMPSDVPASKVGLLRALGDLVEVIHVAKPAEWAREEGKKAGHYHLNQYGHMGNIKAHENYTGPEIIEALGFGRPRIGVVAIAMGSGGTIGGIGRHFKKHSPGTVILGVQPALGQQVPGARDKKKMADVVTIPWDVTEDGAPTVDAIVEVSRKASFEATRRLWGAVGPQPGPTSGMAYAGLTMYLESLGEGLLETLSDKCVAFVCPDDGRFYSDLMIAELDPSQGM